MRNVEYKSVKSICQARKNTVQCFSANVRGVSIEGVLGRSIEIAAPDDESIARAIQVAVSTGGRLIAAGRRDHTLEEVYFALQGEVT